MRAGTTAVSVAVGTHSKEPRKQILRAMCTDSPLELAQPESAELCKSSPSSLSLQELQKQCL